ncbi:MAG: beta-galactosidase [Armatimonadetes bacterium]|nr:beta-galactosidase [Armatimonadota bacterium]
MYKLRFRQVHLDFHTSEKIVGIGSRFDPDHFADTLARARVNSVTCFSRCHHGLIYHDTRFEARHPHLERNLLKEQIEACHARDIRVPIYISVGLDEFMARRHPEWLEVDVNGRRAGAGPLQAGYHKLCLNTPYLDYVLEQTMEVMDLFGPVDGFFFDIISQGQCVCPYCLEGMQQQGLDPTDEHARIRFAKGVVDDYKRRFAKAIRERDPNCSIFHNSGHIYPDWRPILNTYSHLELESLPSGGWGYLHFPLTVRYARTLGLDYMAMTGKFHKSWGDFSSYKNLPALEYDCFTALAYGAKCSIGDQLHPTGEPSKATYDLIGAVYRQVEAKEPWCDNVVPQVEIALYNPEAVGLADARVDTAAAGAQRMLTEGHHQFDVVDTQSDWSRYRVVILPDKILLCADLQKKVAGYLAGGGSLILSYEAGMDASRRGFAVPGAPAEPAGLSELSPDFVVMRPALAEGLGDAEQVMYEPALNLRVAEGAEVLADIWHPYFNRTWEHFCSHFHTPCERRTEWPAIVQKGRIIQFAHPIFGMYQRHGVRAYKLMVLNALARLLPNPLVQTDAPTTTHLTVNRQPAERRSVLHLLHYIPERRAEGIDTIEDVIPLYNVAVALRTDQEPARVYLAPSGQEIPCRYEDGYARVVVPEVRGHQMVVFQD